MKWFKVIFVFCVMLLVMMVFVGCVGLVIKESMGGYIDDIVVIIKVKMVFFNDKDIKFLEISVQIFKGCVQLSGFVFFVESVK